MSTVSIPNSRTGSMPRRELRVVAVVGAALSALGVWLVAEKLVGLELHQPAFGPGAAPLLPAWLAAGVAGLLALAGWGLLAVLEHFRDRGARIWLYVAAMTLVLSLGNPLSGQGIGIGNRLALVSMHLVAGGIVIPVLYLSASRRGAAADPHEAA